MLYIKRDAKKGGKRTIFLVTTLPKKKKGRHRGKVGSHSNYKIIHAMQVNSLAPHIHKSRKIKKMSKFNFINRDGETKLPPGFRFQPTDEEIVFQYLAPKIFSCPLPASVIPEIQDVSDFHLWNLPAGSPAF